MEIGSLFDIVFDVALILTIVTLSLTFLYIYIVQEEPGR